MVSDEPAARAPAKRGQRGVREIGHRMNHTTARHDGNANHQHAPLHVNTARNRYNEWWRFYPCIGNAVAVPLIKEVGLAIARTLELAGGSPEPHLVT